MSSISISDQSLKTNASKYSPEVLFSKKKEQWRIQLTRWEFWPFWVIYFPVIFYWTWLTIKARSFWFFTSANPSIHFGGLMGESKYELYRLIPAHFQPKTVFVAPGSSLDDVKKALMENQLSFPVIAKPDIGDRGWQVAKINGYQELNNYLTQSKVSFLLQEFVDYPLELGIFYYRFPGEEKGTISSIVEKGFLNVIGDGKSTLAELVSANPRGLLQFKRLKALFTAEWDSVLPAGEKKVLEEIGNHCRGTLFLDGRRNISPKLSEVFDGIADQIPNFHFGRFDIRCKNIQELEKGSHFKIIELNGAGGEPGHIYQPGTSILEGYKVITQHLNILYKISRSNHYRGYRYLPFFQGLKLWWQAVKYSKTHR